MQTLDKMKIWQQIAIIVLILTIPTAYLAYQLASEKNLVIDIAAKERDGVEYLQPLFSLLQHVMEHRDMAQLLLDGDESLRNASGEIQTVIQRDLEQVEFMHNRLGAAFKTSEQWLAVKTGWDNLRDKALTSAREESFSQHTALVKDILSLVTRIGDNSHLILDPDLDSFNLMKVSVVILPPLLETIGTLGAKSVRAANGNAITEEAKIELVSLHTKVRDGAESIRSSMDTAFQNNASLKSDLGEALSEFEERARTFTQSAGAVTRSTNSELANIVTSTNDILSQGSATINAGLKLNAVTSRALDGLLVNRISELNKGKWLALLQALFGFAICLLCTSIISRRINRNASFVVSIMKQLSKGNFTVDLYADNHQDEFSMLFNSCHDLQTKLVEVIRGIRAGAGEVAVAADQVSQGNANLSQRTQEQASSLEEVASSMEQMTSTVRQNADNTQQANQLARAAREQADKGGQVVTKTVSAMGEISGSSKRIADIIGVIDEIAFQTNLLALNAAVEAARAGEQGRGFAVVATEVRNLAGRSATAAKEIKMLIQDSLNKTQDGAKLVDESGKMLEEIVASVKKVSDIVAEIAAASQEQASGINQVNRAVLQMDEMTQQNAALVEEASAASEAMGAQAEELRGMMEYFKVKEDGTARARSNKPASLGTGGTQSAARIAGATGNQAVAQQRAIPKLQTDDDTDWQEF